jgi:L-galactose dehydrogenase
MGRNREQIDVIRKRQVGPEGDFMEYTMLGQTDLNISKLGLGGAQLPDLSDDLVQQIVHTSLECGINFFDTAPLYGMGSSETKLGKALQGKREKVVLATKTLDRQSIPSYDATMSSIEGSLTRLGTDYIDLIQIHEPEYFAFEDVMQGPLKAIQELKSQGVIRAVGINAKDLNLLVRYMDTEMFDTLQIYTRYMLIDCTAQKEVLPLSEKLGMGVINGSVLGMGILAEAPYSFLAGDLKLLHEADERMKALKFLRKPEAHGFVEPAMRFSLGSPSVQVTLTGASSVDIVRKNASYCDGKGLPQDELEIIAFKYGDSPLFD